MLDDLVISLFWVLMGLIALILVVCVTTSLVDIIDFFRSKRSTFLARM